jgi:microcystin-dependent protein
MAFSRMSLNRTSLDTEVLILRRMYAMSTSNIPVINNYILATGSQGEAYFQNTLNNISSYGFDLSSNFSTIYGRLSSLVLSTGVTYPEFYSTISGLYDTDSQIISSISSLSSSVSQLNSTVNNYIIASTVTQSQFTSSISGIYGTISTLSTSQGAAISTNFQTLSGYISSNPVGCLLSSIYSANSTSTAALLSSLSNRISANTTGISTVNNYLDLRISSLSSQIISSYDSLSSIIANSVISSYTGLISTFSTVITQQLISTGNSLGGQISTLSTQVAVNKSNILALSTFVSTNVSTVNGHIISTGNGIYNNPYFLNSMTISGSLSVSGFISSASSIITNESIIAQHALIDTDTNGTYIFTGPYDISKVSLQVNSLGNKIVGATGGYMARALINGDAHSSSALYGTLGLYDINNDNISTNTGSSLIFGGAYANELWYRAKMTVVAPPDSISGGSINGVAGDIVFSTKDNDNSTSLYDRMRIKYNGNVIIGSPSTTNYKLDVGGVIGSQALSTNQVSSGNIRCDTIQAISVSTATLNSQQVSTALINSSPTISGILTIQPGGTSVTPSIIFGTPLDGGFLDDNTGIYHPAANSIAITCNGVPHITCSTNTVIMNVNTYNASDVTISGNLTICGSIISNSAASIPIGGIIMWSGSITTIPGGWALCNGISGTPDLCDRFIVGAGGSLYTVGASGGLNHVTLDISQIPAHNHTITDPGHIHGTKGWWGVGSAAGDSKRAVADGDVTDYGYPGNQSVMYNMSTGITINNRGDGQPHENRPPYYALAYIMRIT